MFRGTTPKLVFTLPFDTSLIDKIYITFQQKYRKAIEKDITTCKVDKNNVTLTPTQHDTLTFVSNYPVSIQLRVLLKDGSAVASKVIERHVKDVLKDGVI